MDDPNYEILQSCKVNELKLLAANWRDVHNIYMLLCLVTQLCLILCDPMDCGLPGSSIHGHAPGKKTGVGCHAFFQGTFQTQGSKPGLPHCWLILYRLNHQGSPYIYIYIYVCVCVYLSIYIKLVTERCIYYNPIFIRNNEMNKRYVNTCVCRLFKKKKKKTV